MKINAIADENDKISHYLIIISDISAQKAAEEKLRHLAHYDYLTDLPNRKLVLEQIKHTIKEYQYDQKPSALFFIDLDKFKQVNDSLGHHAGDELLKYVANTLVNNVKNRDFVARQSGDEFMILIKHFDNLEHLSHLAQRINQCLSQPITLKGNKVTISSSIGIAIFPDDATNAEDLIHHADLAMMHAKQAGRSNFQFYTAEMNQQAHRRLTLENLLNQATENNSLFNMYQPIVDCQQHEVIGFELLMRWQHQDEMIPPSEFIPIAEEMGLISQLTEQAIDRALTDYPKLAERYGNIYISVNLSPVHILQQGIVETLDNLLRKHQLSAGCIRLEITENSLLIDKQTAEQRLKELNAMGVKLLLDDFGTGYSSLTYLSQFPIDVLKIDQSFVRNLQTNPMNKPIVKSIVTLANSLSLQCITEGIETEEQLKYIAELGCFQIQGYYFAKPCLAAELIVEQTKQTLLAKIPQDLIIGNAL